MKEGDHSRTNLAHSAERKARVAEILADDVGIQTKMRKAQERKEGERRPLEPIPKMQGGGSNSSGSAPVETPAHASSKEKMQLWTVPTLIFRWLTVRTRQQMSHHLCQNQ